MMTKMIERGSQTKTRTTSKVPPKRAQRRKEEKRKVLQ